MTELPEQASSICAYCRERVEPEADGVIEAARLVRSDALGGSSGEWIEGVHVYFHDHHYPYGSSRYRRVSTAA